MTTADSLQIEHFNDSLRQADSLSLIQSVEDSLMQAAMNREITAKLVRMHAEEAQHDQVITILAVSVVVVIFGSFFLYNIFNNRYWERGIFPPMLLNRRINHYEAIVNISVNLIRCDIGGYAEKQKLLNQFMRRKFPDIAGNVVDSLKSALASPVSTESVAYWMNKRIKNEAEKEQILSFLFNLASMDEVIGQKEQAILSTFIAKMNMDPSVLEKMIADQRRTKGERIHSEQERTRQAKKRVYSGDRLESAAAVLGLTGPCTMEEVKKAYRKQVMLYHPDKFQNDDAASMERAEEKFLDIQEAYEYLEGRLG